MVIAGYIIMNRPMGTPSEMSAGTLASNVPPAIDLMASMGGVSSKSEIDSALPMAMPMAMLTMTKMGSRRKSSSFSSRRPVVTRIPGSPCQSPRARCLTAQCVTVR